MNKEEGRRCPRPGRTWHNDLTSKSARSLFWTSRIICLKWSEPSSPHCSDRIVGASTGGCKNRDVCVLCPGSGAVCRTRDCKHEAQCLPAPLVRWRLGPTGHPKTPKPLVFDLSKKFDVLYIKKKNLNK